MPRPCDEDTSAQPPSPRARSIIPLTPKPGVTCRLLVSKPSPSSSTLERDLVAEREQLHVNALGARVFANVRQRLLRHAIHRGRAVWRNLELFAVGLKVDFDSAALGKPARQPLERGDEAGVEHGGPQRVLNPVAGDHGGLEQLRDRIAAAVGTPASGRARVSRTSSNFSAVNAPPISS